MPFKTNVNCRHHIPRERHHVTNSAAYDSALRQRGSLTVWFTDAAITAWKAEPRTTRVGQPRYSPLAIATALTLRVVFHLALRQTEGLIGSVLALLGPDLAVPDHSPLSRRAETLVLPLPRSGSGPMHLPVDSTGRKLCGSGEWFKRVIGNGLRSRTDQRRGTEIALAVGVLNRMLELGRPDTSASPESRRQKACAALSPIPAT